MTHHDSPPAAADARPVSALSSPGTRETGRGFRPGPAGTMVADDVSTTDEVRLAMALAGPASVLLAGDLATSEARTAARYAEPPASRAGVGTTLRSIVEPIGLAVLLGATVYAILFL